MPAPLESPLHIPAALQAADAAISFEFFPPKDNAGEEALWEAVSALESVQPSFVSVTYGAGGSTQDRTIRVTEKIAHETSLTPLAHLTCVGASVDQLREVIGAYERAGVRHILALRGDPPGDLRGPWVAHDRGLNHADELVRLVRDHSHAQVGVAAFPDVHPESADLEQEVRTLVAKADAGASFAVTQMVFDAESYLRLRDAVTEQRELPMTPALMPVTNLKQVKRMSELMGTPLPAPVVARLEAVADDAQAVREVGIEIATELGERMLNEGAPGLHFITMNRSSATLEVYQRLGLGTSPQG